MATATEKTIMTPAEYAAKGEEVRQTIACWHLCLDATIDDYPIGRRDRGKCRLQVERSKGKGYRTVRTTTNNRGIWCKPKKSVFHDGVHVVATNVPPEYDYDIQWLSASTGGVGLIAASGSCHVLLKAPHWCKPRREDRPYTMNISYGEGVVETQEHVDKADSPELCDAWDAWFEEYMKIRTLLLETWKDA